MATRNGFEAIPMPDSPSSPLADDENEYRPVSPLFLALGRTLNSLDDYLVAAPGHDPGTVPQPDPDSATYWRDRALAFHADRCAAIGSDVADLAEEFVDQLPATLTEVIPVAADVIATLGVLLATGMHHTPAGGAQ